MTSSIVYLLFLCGAIAVQGSIIKMTSSTTSLKPPLTENFTLRCFLQDTTQSLSLSGQIIGRKRRHVTGSPSQVTESANQQTPNKRSIGVTSTATNADSVTSIVISRDGKNLAAVSETVPAKAMVSSPGFIVTGSLSENSEERAFLQLMWEQPTQADGGSYRCNMEAVDLTGGSYDFSQTLQISAEDIALSDLVDYVKVVAREKSVMNATIASMNTTINSLLEKNQDMTSQLYKTNKKILFSAGLVSSGTHNIPTEQGVVFNHVFSNVGGAYQPGSGVFTCPIPGYYAFSFNAGTVSDKSAFLRLQHNNNDVIEAFSAGGHGYRNLNNDVILKLDLHDKVRIVTRAASDVFSTSDYLSTTFSGQLLEVV